jgi:ketosteroid isomerase-like protein
VTYSPAGLGDRQDIVDVCVRYALALDSRDWKMLATCFTEDAVANYEGRPPARGYSAIEQTCRSALDPLAASQHLLGNHLVTVGSDEAEALCYFQAQHVRAGAGGVTQLIIAGRYEDRFVRTEQGWRIAERTLKTMWIAGDEAVLGLPAGDRQGGA